jgi:SAM-dependent methyltransferase
VSARRYVDDVPYELTFFPELSPAWLDFVALLWGVAPVDRARPFAWCDLGCGQGVNAVVLAATHPSGSFHGLDAMPAHIEHAAGLARACGAGNAAFLAVDFGAALKLDLPQFDYITAHGVYSWVDDRARADLVRFVDARLKPGGRVYLSYNALPGRAADQPFQQLILALGETFQGDSVARVQAALSLARRMAKVNAAPLVASPMARLLLKPDRRGRGERYLAHELLNPHWRPLSVVQVRQDLAAIGLAPAGSARIMDNFDSYMLTRGAQRVLDEVDDADLRELVRDHLVNAGFRQDVYVRDPQVLGESDRLRQLRGTRFALARPAAQVGYRLETPAGEVGFDNPLSRAIVRRLAAGPASLAEIGLDGDGLPSLLALAAAGHALPVEARACDVGALNREVAARWGGPQGLRLAALGCGTALQPPAKVMDALTGRRPQARPDAWARHLAAYGARFE